MDAAQPNELRPPFRRNCFPPEHDGAVRRRARSGRLLKELGQVPRHAIGTAEFDLIRISRRNSTASLFSKLQRDRSVKTGLT